MKNSTRTWKKKNINLLVCAFSIAKRTVFCFGESESERTMAIAETIVAEKKQQQQQQNSNKMKIVGLHRTWSTVQRMPEGKHRGRQRQEFLFILWRPFPICRPSTSSDFWLLCFWGEEGGEGVRSVSEGKHSSTYICFILSHVLDFMGNNECGTETIASVYKFIQQ